MIAPSEHSGLGYAPPLPAEVLEDRRRELGDDYDAMRHLCCRFADIMAEEWLIYGRLSNEALHALCRPHNKMRNRMYWGRLLRSSPVVRQWHLEKAAEHLSEFRRAVESLLTGESCADVLEMADEYQTILKRRYDEVVPLAAQELAERYG